MNTGIKASKSCVAMADKLPRPLRPVRLAPRHHHFQSAIKKPDMTQQARVEDFPSRLNDSPDAAYRHPTHGWRYIPIHPFADELEILERLVISPADCVAVDAYWEIEGDVVFLETMCERDATRPKGIYVRTGKDAGTVAHAILPLLSITHAEFEDTMTALFEAGCLFDTFPDALTEIRSDQASP